MPSIRTLRGPLAAVAAVTLALTLRAPAPTLAAPQQAPSQDVVISNFKTSWDVVPEWWRTTDSPMRVWRDNPRPEVYKFRFEPSGLGTYRIRNVGSDNRCLQPYQGRTALYTQIWQVPCDGSQAQQWYWQPVNAWGTVPSVGQDGLIVSRLDPNRVIGMQDSAERGNHGHYLQLEEPGVFPHQIWKLRPWSPTPS